jgi:hypothetical protein
VVVPYIRLVRRGTADIGREYAWGDFTKLRVYVRQDAHLDVDASGVLVYEESAYRPR